MKSSNVQGKKVAIVGGGLVGNAACLLFDCWEVRGWLLSKGELEREGLWKGSSSARRLLWALQSCFLAVGKENCSPVTCLHCLSLCTMLAYL